jgi:acyl carrier protein
MSKTRIVTKSEVVNKIEQRKKVLDKVKNILVERLRLNLSPEDIADNSPLFGLGLQLDSIDALEIVVGIEQEFKISITDEDMQVFRSVNTIADFILEKLAKGEGEL